MDRKWKEFVALVIKMCYYKRYYPFKGGAVLDQKSEQRRKLAQEILTLSRNTLLVSLRFLDMALSQFTYHEVENNTLLTDGKYLLFDPKHVLSSYKLAKEIPVRDYLHMVMHCVFRHMYMDPSLNQTRFS